jgi:hypothetical protein
MTQLVRSGVSRRTGRRAARRPEASPDHRRPARLERRPRGRRDRNDRSPRLADDRRRRHRDRAHLWHRGCAGRPGDDGEQAQRGEQPHLRPPEAMAISPQLWRKRRFLSSDFLPERWGPRPFWAWRAQPRPCVRHQRGSATTLRRNRDAGCRAHGPCLASKDGPRAPHRSARQLLPRWLAWQQPAVDLRRRNGPASSSSWSASRGATGGSSTPTAR